MPSTYSTSLKLELIGNGEQAGAWGTTTNNNLGTLLEQAITGVLPLTIYGDTTLTNYNGLSDEARNAVLFLTGNLTSSANVIAPSGQQKVYIVRNFTGNTVNIKTTSGNAVSLTNAASAVVFTDGTDFYSATTLNYIDGNLTVTGTTNLQGAVTCNTTVNIGGNLVISANLIANSSTGQFYLPVGTGAQRTASPINGLIRYNTDTNGSDTGFYEGYKNGVWIKFLTANQNNYTMSYVVVAGGAGAASSTYGGGAGQFLASSTVILPNVVYTFTVGGGGAGSGGGATGTSSVITGIATATGGLASGYSGNGYSPGSGTGTDAYGGGAGSAGNGGAGTGGSGGAGGPGTTTLITGGSQTLAGGGGGGGYYIAGTGTDGGGNGGSGPPGGTPTGGNPATVNTGSGGGAGGLNTGLPGGNGGSGKIIISVPTTSYSGTTTGSPTIFTSGSNTILVYNSSGTYTG